MAAKPSRKRRPRLMTALLLRGAALIAPRYLERRVARAFVTPRPRYPALSPRAELPAPDQSIRLAIPGEGAFVTAWRWGWGPAVLFVHGWEDDHRCFGPLIKALRARGQAAVALDLPAHGRSGGRMLAMPALIRAIADVAAALGPVRALVGHSLGGLAAMLTAAQGLSIERAVVIAAPISTRRTLVRVAARLRLSSARCQGIARELERGLGAPVEAFDLERAMPRLEVPGLIVHSRDDRQVSLASSELLARAWRGAELHLVNGLGHRRVLADPGVIARLADFLTADTGAAEASVTAGLNRVGEANSNDPPTTRAGRPWPIP